MSKDYSGLALRMKTYETINKQFLIPGMNNILRLDGRAFHTYTKKFKRPFDDDLISAMDAAAIYLCSNIQGVKFGYVQSDEISICFTDYDTYETTLWYDGNIQKIVSVAASMCAAKFNHIRTQQIVKKLFEADSDTNDSTFVQTALDIMKLAEFDARIFQVPNKEEVVNNIMWRQQDCIRNSISSVAQSIFPHKDLYKINTDKMREMIVQACIERQEYSPNIVNWDNLSAKLQRGRFIVKNTYVNGVLNNDYAMYKKIDKLAVKLGMNKGKQLTFESDVVRSKWESVEGPILSQDRNFLLNFLPNI